MSDDYQIFKPVNMPLRGSLTVPGDKSIAMRAIFMASMAQGTSHIFDIPKSLDVMSVVDVVKQLGAKVKVLKSNHRNSVNFDLEITGWGEDGPKRNIEELYCGNSATCARVLMGILSPYEGQ